MNAGRKMTWSKRLRFWLGLRFRSFASARTSTDTACVLKRARQIIKKKRYALLCTHGDTGINARVMQPWHPDVNFVVWMGTSPSSRKSTELRDNPAATLVYQQDPQSSCVVLKGNVTLFGDADVRAERFMPAWSAFWPEGPDSDFVALRFETVTLEIIDFKARITPEPFGLRAVRLARRGDDWVPAD